MSKKLRFALFGCGDFGPHFAPYILEIADLVAICDPNPAALSAFSQRLKRPFHEYGEPIAITSCQYYDARPYNLQGWWTRSSQSGGLLDIADVHILDWMRAMCGDIETVRAV